MKDLKPQFDFDDILIVPKYKTHILSRYKGIKLEKKLPLFTAPMDSVIDLKNINTFLNQGINVTLPRTIKYEQFVTKEILAGSKTDNGVFISMGIEDLDIELRTSFRNIHENAHILIDVANGHMQKLFDYCREIKRLRPDIILMIGNVANPKTYEWYVKNTDVDYIRVGIGNGNGCWVDGTEILTINGYKKIENLEIDDYVLTHDGSYQSIQSKISYVSNEKLYDINGERCTESHEIYVINKSDINNINDDNYMTYCYWVRAKNINEKSHLIVSWCD
ncbi:MAG: IMP dehydrogenase [Bacteroidales bacterium]|jgi:hypothetical protein|nr:IMP dehydrogenase [Bacteroidales bacterium]